MDVLERLKELQQARGWSDYKIAKRAGLAPNTVSNFYRRGNTPSFDTLGALCKAFDITLMQFFAEGDMMSLTSEQKGLLDRWVSLTDEQRAAVWHVIDSYKK